MNITNIITITLIYMTSLMSPMSGFAASQYEKIIE